MTGIPTKAIKYEIDGEIEIELLDIKSITLEDEKTTKRMYVHNTTINITE